ncbi:MAG: DUF1802 family protein [Planctomycetia bacterium]|nr:DUF1802 family protein [Planctomycetia bacterium]
MKTAFKEWAVICRALADGRQDVILRKGGVAEDGGSFSPAHREFLLLPTFLHQSAESIRPEHRDLLDGIEADRPPEGTVVLRHAAAVVDALLVHSLDELAAFRGRHVWSDAVVEERLRRWQEQLHVLVVRVTPLPRPLSLPWREAYGGCRSWVELDDAAAV